ncbi:Uncharacterised protein [Mycobacteroides abscessus subsp. abscessus]|uniref:hypothetical protein n=1 Tax=Mycobacteroides abscessus TaxID=36809 RepID=UPI000927C991|nr:hypothetical protein [Mycobacteroides abscessus]SII19037.1 Uncharacterised protein [Mycobacteroides abscessus subsp. abscessus]SII32293.1 Uncharacterised protein [Mycobacteroides abscessus subsp. abscessus]SII64186.1 Uncharacterised protein [Mycobacteroides abscessus subsp. abscessus]
MTAPTPSLVDLATEAGMTGNCTPLELGRIASTLAYTEFIPLSPYETTRALLRMQREKRPQKPIAAVDSETVTA